MTDQHRVLTLENLHALPIEELELTTRTYNCLKQVGANTVGELLERSEQDILEIRGLDWVHLDEIRDTLRELSRANKVALSLEAGPIQSDLSLSDS